MSFCRSSTYCAGVFDSIVLLAQAAASNATPTTATVKPIDWCFMLPPSPVGRPGGDLLRALQLLPDLVAHGRDRLDVLRDGGPIRQRHVLVARRVAVDDFSHDPADHVAVRLVAAR